VAFTQRRAHGVEVGILAGIADILIFQHFMGAGLSDIMATDAHNPMDERSERNALYTSLGLNTVTAFFMRSWDTFVVSGAVLVGIDFAIKHAVAVSPATGKMTQGQAPLGGSSGLSNVMPMPDYTDGAQQAG
jgi:hypothetical protein